MISLECSRRARMIATVAQPLRPDRRTSAPARLREVIRQFTPNWFTVTMGTGILALALNQVPWAIPGLPVIAEALWFLNIGLFLLFSVLYAARWIMFFDQAGALL